MPRFDGSFTRQEPIPEDAIARAVEVMRSGRLHRYNVVAADDVSETAQLELDFARYQGARYCLACASGGYAMQLAMRAAGVGRDAVVLTNAWTLSPVPGAIHAVGGRPGLVETTDDLVIDLDDLAAKLDSSGARFVLMSHMRGHIVDMHAAVALCERFGATLIEDCAHTMGASFDGVKSGGHGALACFSTQTYKHVNSGEGGLVTTDDDALMAKLVLMSGSYMLHGRHASGPPPEVFDEWRLEMPNLSGRMDELRAAILRPQLARLDENARRWNERYRAVADALGAAGPGVALPAPHPLAREVRSSIQFMLPGITDDGARAFVEDCARSGVDVKWFGAASPVAYTSRHESWRHVEPATLPNTDRLLAGLFDVRLPLSFGMADCGLVGEIVAGAIPGAGAA